VLYYTQGENNDGKRNRSHPCSDRFGFGRKAPQDLRQRGANDCGNNPNHNRKIHQIAQILKADYYILRGEQDEVEIDVTVTYNVYGRHIAASSSGPEEWPVLEIVSCVDAYGNKYKLTDAEKERFYEKIEAKRRDEE
jgi:hypothetical protein